MCVFYYEPTTVQQRGQNHHISSRASSRKTTSKDMSTMVPSNWGKAAGTRINGAPGNQERREKKKKKVKRKKLVYSQPPLMDRHNRGELRERDEKTEERTRNGVKELVQMQQRRGTADLSSCTHAFSRGDVNRAGDVGEALVHAHLQVDHPAKQANITHTRPIAQLLANAHSCTVRA